MKKPYMAGSILFVVVIISTLFASVEIFSRADGVVVAENSAIKISSPQAGIVEEVFVKSGQHIKKGKVIAKLTDSEIKINLENLYKELNYARNKLLVLNNIIYNKSFQTPYRPSLFQLLQEKQEDYIKETLAKGEKKFMGKTFDGIHRTSFIIDKTGKILKTYKKVKPKVHL